MFFTCKQVSNQLSKEDYEHLKGIKKWTLVFHVFICPVCGAYNKQVMKFQDLARKLRNKEDAYLESTEPDAPRLSEESRQKMAASLEANSKQED